ncbi:unnamed protein product [Colias eurytheme]|nr:unnamed protein product [Colias eurytheme]
MRSTFCRLEFNRNYVIAKNAIVPKQRLQKRFDRGQCECRSWHGARAQAARATEVGERCFGLAERPRAEGRVVVSEQCAPSLSQVRTALGSDATRLSLAREPNAEARVASLQLCIGCLYKC